MGFDLWVVAARWVVVAGRCGVAARWVVVAGRCGVAARWVVEGRVPVLSTDGEVGLPVVVTRFSGGRVAVDLSKVVDLRVVALFCPVEEPVLVL